VFPVKNTRNILHPSVPATDRQRYQRPSRHVTAGAGSDGNILQQLPACCRAMYGLSRAGGGGWRPSTRSPRGGVGGARRWCAGHEQGLLESSSRSSTIRSMVDCASRVGLVCGRRERCWKAASPRCGSGTPAETGRLTYSDVLRHAIPMSRNQTCIQILRSVSRLSTGLAAGWRTAAARTHKTDDSCISCARTARPSAWHGSG